MSWQDYMYVHCTLNQKNKTDTISEKKHQDFIF